MAKADVTIKYSPDEREFPYWVCIEYPGSSLLVSNAFTEREYRKGKHLTWLGTMLDAGPPRTICKFSVGT